MATNTSRLGLRKPDDVAPNDDLVDVTLDIANNMDIIDRDAVMRGARAVGDTTINNEATNWTAVNGMIINDIQPGFYRFELTMRYSTSEVADIHFRFSKSGSGLFGVFQGTIVRYDTSAATTNDANLTFYSNETSNSFICGGISGTEAVFASGLLEVVNAPINLFVEFKQNTAEAVDTLVFGNSFMSVDRVFLS